MQQEVPQLRFAAVRLASDPRVHYAEQGDPGGEPILFLPAYTDSWFSYSRVLPLLPPRHHAYALDQRGHGDSERPNCCYTVEELQRAAARVTLPEPFFERLVAESLKLPARVWKSTLERLFAFDDAMDLARIAAPTLLIWGSGTGGCRGRACSPSEAA
jgi:pimeloyl-ACP methyl ester carboxylesterase